MAEISLRDVAKYYNNQEHQNFALDFLQDQIPPGTMAKFSDLWRSGPKNNIPSTGSWDGVVELARKAGAKYPELVAAQWALESNWGKDTSGVHNYFGLKGTGKQLNTTEYINGKAVTIKDGFKNFSNLEESVNYLVDRWYKDYKTWNGANNASNVNEAAKWLIKEGYATDPKYVAKLLALVNKNKSSEVRVGQLLKVPYEYQLDNGPTGYRECFSSSCAMVARYYGKCKNDNVYNQIRSVYGDSTDVNAQLKALKFLGLNATFTQKASEALLRAEIDAGRPLVCGWLHKGPVGAPGGGGHYSVAIGYTADSWIMNDPNGQADLVNGGYLNHTKGKEVSYSKKNWNKRWLIEGPNSGWAVIIKP